MNKTNSLHFARPSTRALSARVTTGVSRFKRVALTTTFFLAFTTTLWSARPTAAEILFEAGFGPGAWDAGDWVRVKSPRWDYQGSWIQRDDHIENKTPPELPPDTLVPVHRAYTAMVFNEELKTDRPLEISASMEFEYDQGPQIVLAYGLGEGEDGHPVFREHHEIVLFARGVNVWHHTYRDGSPSWALVAYSRFPLERRTPYTLTVRIENTRRRVGGPAETGKTIAVSVDGERLFAYHEPALPDRIQAGIIGYGSINRFYSFQVRRP